MKNKIIFSIALLLFFTIATTQTALAQGWIQNPSTQSINTNTLFNNTPGTKLGIGMTTPNARLDILGGPDWSSNHWQKSLQINNGSAMSFRISPTLSFGMGASSSNQTFTIFTTADGNTTPTTSRIAIKENGNVGIGTINPEYKMDVRGSASVGGADLVLGRHDSRPQKAKLLNRALVHYPGSHPQADNLILNFDGDFEDGVIVSGPGLAIGAPWRLPSGYMLSVGGKVICEELKVQLKSAWPDYVFAKTNRLPTLEEVERHIQEKQHLPGIPSAAEVAENGLSVGEMQTKMMEKIEELTLYLIDLKKDNTLLRQEVEILKQK